MEANNMKALREALVKLRQRFDNNVMAYQDRYLKFSGWHWHKKAAEAARWRDVFRELREVCDAALAEPARQCDVGTPYEQANRMRQFCDKQKRNGIINCGYCPIKHQYQRDCTLAWAQMSYAEEGRAQ